MTSKMTLWVTTQFEGFHKWEQAPDEVAYLREKHRHMFGVRVGVDVHVEEDRVIEFHMLKRVVNEIISQYVTNGHVEDVGSCEVIAKHIASRLACIYGPGTYHVEVNEDGECGASFVTS